MFFKFKISKRYWIDTRRKFDCFDWAFSTFVPFFSFVRLIVFVLFIYFSQKKKKENQKKKIVYFRNQKFSSSASVRAKNLLTAKSGKLLKVFPALLAVAINLAQTNKDLKILAFSRTFQNKFIVYIDETNENKNTLRMWFPIFFWFLKICAFLQENSCTRWLPMCQHLQPSLLRSSVNYRSLLGYIAHSKDRC